MTDKSMYHAICCECGGYVAIDLDKIRCKKCLDKQARELLRRKLGSRAGNIDPGALKKALGLE